MSKAVSSNPFIESISTDFPLTIYTMIVKYHPLMHKLMGNVVDTKDSEQKVIVKILSRLSAQSNWWNQIENKRAYLLGIIKNKALNLWTHKFFQFVNYGKDESKVLTDNLSDNGIWAKDLNKEMDLQQQRIILKEIMDGFSEYDQQILQLNFVEGRDPKEVAMQLKVDYEEAKIDCNRVKATFRGKLKKKIL